MLTKNKVIIRKRDFMNNKAILMFCDLEGTLLNEKNGFTVHVSSPFDENRKLFNVTISWGNAYKNVIPYLVYSYTTGSINTFPESQISTFAQRLYVTAKRANTF